MRTFNLRILKLTAALLFSCSSEEAPVHSKGDTDNDSALQSRIADLEQRVVVLEAQASKRDGTSADTGKIQETLTSLTTRVAALEQQAPSTSTVRVDFLEFRPDRAPLAGGEDYLIDAELSDEEGECYAYGRTGHSRFIIPRYLDLRVSRTSCTGRTVTVRVYAYWHLDDILIDIDPDPASGRCPAVVSPNDPSGCFFTTSYPIGEESEGTVDGSADGFFADSFNAIFSYRISMID